MGLYIYVILVSIYYGRSVFIANIQIIDTLPLNIYWVSVILLSYILLRLFPVILDKY